MSHLDSNLESLQSQNRFSKNSCSRASQNSTSGRILSTSTSGVLELASITDQYRATGRLRRESLSQVERGVGQASFQILNKSLNSRLNNLELFGNNSRSSVIQCTRNPATSTPSSSPPLIGNPRHCQSTGYLVNPPAENHTSECSEISSIEEDNVFEPVEASGPSHSYTSSDPAVSTKMDAAENFVKAKIRKLNGL